MLLEFLKRCAWRAVQVSGIGCVEDMVPPIDEPHDGSFTDCLRKIDRILRIHSGIIQSMHDADRYSDTPGLSHDIMPLGVRLLLSQPGGIDSQGLSRSG